MQGKSLNLDPVAVLLSLAFWGAIWGLPGMFLSTPLTVMTMVVLAQFKGTPWIAVPPVQRRRPQSALGGVRAGPVAAPLARRAGGAGGAPRRRNEKAKPGR